MNKYKNFGYYNFGPLLLGYTRWLQQQFEEKKLEKVYFFSRDGFIMKQAFDLICGNGSIQTYYLEVSRRSLRVPILWKDYSLNNLLTMLSPSMLISINSIFDALGLSVNDYQDLLSRYGFDENTNFIRKEIVNNEQLRGLYSELGADIENVSRIEYKNLITYLKENNVEGKFAIVDIGWSGSMQHFLQIALQEIGINAEIYGFYTGVASSFKRNLCAGQENPQMYGYLFDYLHNTNDIDCRNCFVGLYEMLFLEPKGSVERYVVNPQGQIEAKRYPYEYVNVDDDFLSEVSCIKDVQQGALQFVSDHRSDFMEKDKFTLCKNLLRAGQKPTTEAIRLFADFRFFDEGECLYLAKPKSLLYYVFHCSDFQKDFLRSRWKTAFLRRLFALPLPYYGIYNLLKKLS